MFCTVSKEAQRCAQCHFHLMILFKGKGESLLLPCY